MKFRGTFVVLAAIIVLMTACRDHLPEFKSPAGMVSLNFNKNVTRDNARTILPLDGGLADFSVFHLEFVNTTINSQPINVYVEGGSAAPSATIWLEFGNYDLTAVGYLNGIFNGENEEPDDLEGPAAIAVMTNIPVVAGTNPPIRITLRAFTSHDDFSDEGTFSWTLNINLSLGINTNVSNTMTITARDDTPPLLDTISLSTPANWNNKTSLPAGFYDVDFQLVSFYNNKTINFSYVLHVYQNWESHFEHDVTDVMADIPPLVILTPEEGIFSPDVVHPGLGDGHNGDNSSFVFDDPLYVLFPHGVDYYPEEAYAYIDVQAPDIDGIALHSAAIRILPSLTGPVWITVKFSGNVNCRILTFNPGETSGIGGTPLADKNASDPDTIEYLTVQLPTGQTRSIAIEFFGLDGDTTAQVYDIIIYKEQ